MKTVLVNTPNPYLITVGKGLLPHIGKECKALLAKAKKILVVADTNVAPLYLAPVMKSLEEAGFEAYFKEIPAGEEHKNLTTYTSILTEAAARGFCRDDAFVALGGGVTGDITGFAAATYMRGIDFIQLPTTLVAGIDASIGGKTGVDFVGGKNLVGAFHQPRGVFFDVDTLATLPEDEIKNGLGEGIKYAVLCGGRIVEILREGIIAEEKEEFCALCAAYKAEVVEKDEKEGSLRQLLNLGHTAGHAIEKLSSYRVSHGQAVAMGIQMMAEGSVKKGVLSPKEGEEILSLLNKYGLKTRIPFSAKLIAEAAKSDKKMHGSSINAVEIVRIGYCRVKKMSVSEFGEYIS